MEASILEPAPPAPEAAAPHGPVRLRALSDERLARMVGRGNDRAFETLYWRHTPALSRYCRSLLQNESDTQDALQSVMTNALLALRQSRRDAPLKPWLFRIAHNESISLIRRRAPSGPDLDSVPEELLGDGRSAQSVAEDRARLATLVDDLGDLPERQRAALVMRELSGLSHDEIATALSISVGVAKQTVLEARRSLAEFGAGRAMDCDAIQGLVSDGDRRTLRARRVRAHLRDCQSCEAFAGALTQRQADLRILAPPLGIAAAAPLLGTLAHAGAGTVSRGGRAMAAGSKAAGAATASKAGAGAVLSTKALLGGASLFTAAVAGTAGVIAVTPTHHHAAHHAVSGAAAAHPAARPAANAATPAPTRTTASHAATPVAGTARHVAARRIGRRSARGVSTGTRAASTLTDPIAAPEASSPGAVVPAPSGAVTVPVHTTLTPTAGSVPSPGYSGYGHGPTTTTHGPGTHTTPQATSGPGHSSGGRPVTGYGPGNGRGHGQATSTTPTATTPGGGQTATTPTTTGQTATTPGTETGAPTRTTPDTGTTPQGQGRGGQGGHGSDNFLTSP